MTRALALVAALGSGTVAGVFVAFSAVVMPALGRLPPHQGVAAMQSINVTAVRPVLMALLFGTAAACVPLTVAALRAPGDRSAALLLAGSGLYLAGTVGVTAAVNVPLNDALAALDPAGGSAGAHWAAYLTRWTRANSVRALAALAAAAAFALAVVPHLTGNRLRPPPTTGRIGLPHPEVPVSSTIHQVSVDCRDPYALAGFWSAVTGWPLGDEDEPGDEEVGLVPPDPATTPLLFLQVPQGKRVKNRLHLDLRPVDRSRDAEVERLLALGARLVDDRRTPTGGWAVLADPEDNEFCVELGAAERGRLTAPG